MNSLSILFLLTGLLGAIAVGLGAFGAHALQERLSQLNRIETWQTAVHYHFFHVLLMTSILILIKQFSTQGIELKWLYIAFWCAFFGVIIFSGSLYTLSLSGINWLGAITPIGGLLFIIAWLSLGYFGWKYL